MSEKIPGWVQVVREWLAGRTTADRLIAAVALVALAAIFAAVLVLIGPTVFAMITGAAP